MNEFAEDLAKARDMVDINVAGGNAVEKFKHYWRPMYLTASVVVAVIVTALSVIAYVQLEALSAKLEKNHKASVKNHQQLIRLTAELAQAERQRVHLMKLLDQQP